MSELSYQDHCVITRAVSGGEVDEYDNPVSITEIYSDKCDWQQGGQTSQSIITHNDVVYLPGHVMVRENDRIYVRNRHGREREGIVKLANDLDLDLTDDCVTEIEIKQSTER